MSANLWVRTLPADPAVTRVDERQQAVRDEAEGHDSEQPRSVRLLLQRAQGAAEVAYDAGVHVQRGLHEEPADDHEGHSPRGEAEPADPPRPPARVRRHRMEPQVLLELRRPTLVELPDPD